MENNPSFNFMQRFNADVGLHVSRPLLNIHEGVHGEEMRCSIKAKHCFNNQPVSTSCCVTSAELLFSPLICVKLVIKGAEHAPRRTLRQQR